VIIFAVNQPQAGGFSNNQVNQQCEFVTIHETDTWEELRVENYMLLQ
jgi:hypothetical protein